MVEKRYAKPKATMSLPGWAKEIRAGAEFMPMRIKPPSYTSLAKVEAMSGSTYRPMVFAAPSAPTTTSTTVGTKYFAPTKDVATGIKKEWNLWQDIKNIGGTIVHKGSSVLMGALDLLSRPRYALMNAYKGTLDDYYKNPGADGKGGDVTGMESGLAFLSTLIAPIGVARDIATGHMDDKFKRGWAGLSGREKTNTVDILKVTNPEFVEKHPLGANIAGLAGDIVFDPVTWITMGTNPGSIARAGVSGGRLLMGEKAAASRLWSETLFTKTGRAAGVRTVKNDIKNKELARLNRKERRVQGKLNKVDQGKKTRLTKSQLQAKAVQIASDKAAKVAEDLQGSALALKIIKKSLPTAGIFTVSRLNTGAGRATAFAGENVLTELSKAFHTGVADQLSEDDKWKAFYALNQNKDFQYHIPGEKTPRTVKLSEAKNFKDFIYKITQEANPIAAYAEHGARASRSRRGRIVGVNAQGQDFITQFTKHLEGNLVNALGDDTGKAMDELKAMLKVKGTSAHATAEELADTKGYLTIDDATLRDEHTTYEKLKNAAQKEWTEATGKDFVEKRASVYYKHADGSTRRITLKDLREAAESEKSQRTTKFKKAIKLTQRSREQAAIDRLVGVTDNVAAKRGIFIDKYNEVKAAREAEGNVGTAAGESTNADLALEQGIKNYLKDAGLTDEELDKYTGYLSDQSVPLEERIATVLKDKGMSNDEANELLEETFKVTIDDNGVIHIPKGGSMDDIPEIIKSVIFDRFAHRITGGELNASGTSLTGEDKFKVVQDYVDHMKKQGPQFTRDINAELGMAILDGWRAAMSYAVQTELYQHPDLLFNELHKTASEFMDLATADSKRQVIQFMVNNTGMRLPENFVPTVDDIAGKVTGKKFKFRKPGDPDGSKTNQEIPWQNLAVEMQSWVTDIFKFVKPDRMKAKNGLPLAKGGTDMDAVKQSIVAKAEDVVSPIENPSPHIEARKAEVDAVVAKVRELERLVGSQLMNGEVGRVDRYSMLDFILHSDEIMKAQTTTMHVAPVGGKYVTRVNAGRLSALDSFTFLDKDAQKGLTALNRLKKMTTSQDPEIAEFAQRELAALFIEHGGLQHIDDISMPTSGNLADINFGDSFNSLGIHARLKEGSFRTSGEKIQSGHVAQLMDGLWGNQSINHEFQKAFQNDILYKVWVEGLKEEKAAEVISKAIDKHFETYDSLKRMLYPVKANGESPAMGTLAGWGRDLQNKWGDNPIETRRNAPMVEGEAGAEKLVPRLEPDQYASRPVLQNKVDVAGEVRKTRQPRTPAPEELAKIDELEKAASQAKLNLEAAILKAKETPKEPEALLALKTARDDYISAMKEHDTATIAATPPEAVPVGAGGKAPEVSADAPQPAPGPALEGEIPPAAAGAVGEEVIKDSADYGNVFREVHEYTPEEIEAIKKYIGITNNTSRPDVVARQIHAISMASAEDMLYAGKKMTSDLNDFNIQYKSNVKFMGIPFMPIKGPMNAMHTEAGVVAMEQQQGSINKFFASLIDKMDQTERGRKFHMEMSRPSQLFEGSLERIRMQIVNYAGMSRKKVIDALDEMYAKALTSEYTLPHINAMNRKQKLQYIKKNLFTPVPKGAPNPLAQFKLADGTNPVQDIASNFHDGATAVFSGDVTKLHRELTDYNRYMHKKFRLNVKGTELDDIVKAHGPSGPLEGLTPYSVEWLREVSKLLPGGTFKQEKLMNLNLGEFHYAMQDAKLKLESGRKLNEGVWKQFAFRSDPETVNVHNTQIVPGTIDVKGNPLRGEWVSLDDIGPKSKWGIDEYHIPAEFRGQGYHVSADILPDIKLLFDYMTETSKLNETINAGFIDKIMNYFKASVTIYNVPSYPIRNLIGDVFMSAIDGLVEPRFYKDAAALIRDYHASFKDMTIENFEGIYDEGFLRKESLRAAHDPASTLNPTTATQTPFKLTLMTADGPIELNGSQVMEAFYALGLGQNRIAGDIPEVMRGARTWKGSQGLGAVHDMLRKANDVREDWSRVSHFLYTLEREAPLGGSYEDIIRRASDRVVKHHFDYNDVSLFERKHLARALPFYKWVRNIIPYTIATVVTKPVALKAENALNSLVGHLVDDDHRDNRRDFVVPEWIEHDNAVPIGSFTDDNNNEFGQWMSLHLPLSDTLKLTLGPILDPAIDPARGTSQKALDVGAGAMTVAGSMTNPLIKGAVQAVTGMEMRPTGAAPEKGNWFETMMAVVPGQPFAEKVKSVAGDIDKGGVHQGSTLAYALEQLGITNLSNNTENNQLGELHRRDDFYRAQLNKRKTEIMNGIQKKYPKTTPEIREGLMEQLMKELRGAEDSGRLR